jgi:hypothetical protein
MPAEVLDIACPHLELGIPENVSTKIFLGPTSQCSLKLDVAQLRPTQVQVTYVITFEA